MNVNEVTGEKQKTNWVSWLVLIVIAGPMLMAYLVYTTGVGIPKGTVNKGELLLPATDIKVLDIHESVSNSKVFSADKKIWRMIIIGNNDCDSVCEQLLYLSRQVHIRLGEKANRIERLYLNTEAGYESQFEARLKKDHPRLIRAQVKADDWRRNFSETSIAGDSLSAQNIYLVDQQGFAMMRYDDINTGADLLDDIKRLLKYSYED